MNYDKSCFQEGYFGAGENNGFREGYNFNSELQQGQLKIKFNQINRFGHYSNVLFVGCSKGFEVRYFVERGKQAHGIDISDFAISNAETVAKPFVQLYDGLNFPFKDNSFDVVAAFDVVCFLPEEIATRVLSEMSRVSRKFVYFRTHVITPYQSPGKIHGQDGCHYSNRSFDWWMKAMTKAGKFSPKEGHFGWHLEFDFWFERNEEHVQYLKHNGV